ncbi:hypothetical protein EVC12_095 [Rhizobium phage RHph_I42]|nr:hypothetical protein EVC12_095 [Rhizobium phage RHph_I42]
MSYKLMNITKSEVFTTGIWLVAICPIEGFCFEDSIFIGETLGI